MLFQLEDDRTVIGTLDISPDDAVAHPLPQRVREKVVVDSPTDILCPRLEPIAPPRIFDLFRI